ncbi:uncharacterized protein [Nicotiana sylvestris]|uniref:uncharacterized protein n=1 Tax=Nicotiana sylvestris TaxID=4096 RepID=UPI00388CD7E3
MSSEGHPPTTPIPKDSPLSVISTSESATAKESRALHLRVLEMWDALSNGREPPSAIPGFPEILPIASGNFNVPISYSNTPLGYPTISAHFTGTPSEVRPQVVSGVASNIFTAPPASTEVQPTVPRPSFDPSSFTFHVPYFPPEPTHFTTNSYPQQPRYEFTAGEEKTTKNLEQEEITRKMRSFKTPKFEKYDGHGDPIAHLKRYCNQLRGAGGKEELLMDYFGESLVGIAYEWYMDQNITCWHIWDDLAQVFVRQFQYNIDVAPDRNSLSNLKKKSLESF